MSTTLGPERATRPASGLRSGLQRRVRRALSRHRLLLVALVLGVGGIAALAATRPPLPPTVPVAVAAHDLTPGRPLGARDVTSARADQATVPDGAYAPAEVPYGRLVAAPARRGEPLTDVSVLGPGVTDTLPSGHVLATVAVRALVPGLLRVGDVVAVVATDPRGSVETRVVASAATVVLVPGEAAAGAGGDGSLLVVAVPEDEALQLSGLSTTHVLDVLVPAAPAR
ncbi:hypothetical protein BH20ACT6_BH20ACT6_16680 [soil metagenome]